MWTPRAFSILMSAVGFQDGDGGGEGLDAVGGAPDLAEQGPDLAGGEAVQHGVVPVGVAVGAGEFAPLVWSVHGGTGAVVPLVGRHQDASGRAGVDRVARERGGQVVDRAGQRRGDPLRGAAREGEGPDLHAVLMGGPSRPAASPLRERSGT